VLTAQKKEVYDNFFRSSLSNTYRNSVRFGPFPVVSNIRVNYITTSLSLYSPKPVKRKKKKIPSRPGGGHGKPLSFTFASGGWGYPPDPH
jgi:hypothetical protein